MWGLLKIFGRNALSAAVGTALLAGAWWLLFHGWPWVWGSIVYGVWVLGAVVAMSVMRWRTERGRWR